MAEKLTNEKKLHKKKLKKPPYVIYNVLGGVWNILFKKKYGLKCNFKTDFKKIKEPHVFISNHASRMDYIFTGLPLLPKTYNFVAGYNEFFRSHLAGVFSLLKVIPKKNFVPDAYTIKEIFRIIKSGGNVVLFPEGMNSISGANQPVAIGTGKLLKHLGVPVYYSLIKGGYLTCPKYANDERLGTVEVDFDVMFTKEDLQNLSCEQIEDVVNEKLYHDDFKWNKEKQYKYKNDGNIAKNLHDLLFWCPNCNKQFTMLGEKNTIRCTSCGNGALIDDAYNFIPFDDKCVIPETQTEWFKMQREVIKKEVLDENFSFSTQVDIGVLPEYELLKNQATSTIVGNGTLTINRNGLTYKGTKNGQDYTFTLSPLQLPTYGMCTDMSRFYTFVEGKFIEFYPKTPCVEKFFLATEEIHRLSGGKWQDFKF